MFNINGYNFNFCYRNINNIYLTFNFLKCNKSLFDLCKIDSQYSLNKVICLLGYWTELSN